MSLVARFQTVVSGLSAVLFPSDCRLCSTPLIAVSRLPVCSECLNSLEPVHAPQCVLCGERLAPAQLLVGDAHCQACRDYPPEFERAVSYGEYSGALRELVHLLKYDGVLPAARPLGKLLAVAIEELCLGNISVSDSLPILVPVPLHGGKRRERRFNQEELIAREARKYLPANFDMDCAVLIRQRETRSQVGLDREARITNMRGAFRVAAADRIQGRTIIVVDDVMTTGTTVSECARVLRGAGADRVFAATVARTLKAAGTPGFHQQPEGEEIEAVQLASV